MSGTGVSVSNTPTTTQPQSATVLGRLQNLIH